MDLVIRRATRADGRALARLAALDSQAVPAGPLLLAEVGGELWAAESIAGGGSIADPFRPTAGVRALLRQRVAQLAAAERDGRTARRRLVGLHRAPAGG